MPTKDSPFSTITEVKLANREIGNHFFDKQSMKFFGSKIETRLLKGRYFVTSEQYNPVESRRLYTVRCVNNIGEVHTIGKFQGHDSLQDAKDAIKDYHENNR